MSVAQRAGAWFTAIRVPTLTASIGPVLVGTGMAEADFQARPLPAAAALAAAILIQIGTNLVNDYQDFRRGSDTEDRVGPTRVTQAGLLEPESVRRGAWVVFGTAFLLGIYLAWVGGWPIVVIGLAAIAAGYAYTAGPFPLAYNGLGDLFVLVFFGPVAVAGTYWVQVLDFRWDLVLAGVGIGALSTALLVVNNLRDRESDERAGKKTLAVLLGPWGARIQYLLLLLVAAAVPFMGVRVWGWSEWTMAAAAALLLAGPALRRVFFPHRPEELNGALGVTARVTGAYAAVLALAFVLGTPAPTDPLGVPGSSDMPV